MSREKRRAMIDREHPTLSVTRQCGLAGLSRSGFYYQPRPETDENLDLMRQIDEQYLKTPWYGSRQMARHLRRQGIKINRKRVQRLMRQMGLMAIAPKPGTSRPAPAHLVYPYLLRDLTIDRPNHVWCADITYIPMAHGFLYLVAIMDWATRRVLSWRLSNTLDSGFCVEALDAAIAEHGTPDIFNTDQGCQFTGSDWIGMLTTHGIRISMDGKGRWMDNVFIERLWRSLKYECVYLNAFGSLREANRKIGHWISYYNHERPHSSLNDLTPNEVYTGIRTFELAA